MPFHFDPQQAAATFIRGVTLVTCIGWPMFDAWRHAENPVAWMRGLVLAITAGLLQLRADSSLTTVAEALVPELHKGMVVALCCGTLSVTWMGTWLAVLPLLAQAAGQSGYVGKICWGVSSAAVVYAAVLVIGPLPGEIARGATAAQAAGTSAAAAAGQAEQRWREARAAAFCARGNFVASAVSGLPEGRRRIDAVRLQNEFANAWSLNLADPRHCFDRAAELTVQQLESAQWQLDNGLLQALPPRLRPPAAPTYEAAPVPAALQLDLASLKLDAYFHRAFAAPTAHAAAVFSATDYLTSFTLLGEAVAAVLWLIEFALLLASRDRGLAMGSPS